jgi:ferredoxin/menaquinone-dependent protoporphyrinogen IX oxidase
MRIQSLKLAYFSPTGTTASIVEALARGLRYGDTEDVDITMADARGRSLHASDDDLLVLAVPVYAGRVPVLLGRWLEGLRLDRTPVVCVAVYGNRDYDDALLELTDIVRSRGGVPVACAAFVGEHSFSTPATPVAVSRPDGDDLHLAETFGGKVREAMDSLSSVDEAPDIAVPGNRPYRELKKGVPVDFIEVGDACIQCGTCAEKCPVGAIAEGAYDRTDAEKCIKCCACIKFCPEGARTAKPDSQVAEFGRRLTGSCRERKEPVWFL